jgi:putative tricarboxylic transport membrane protein
MNKKRELGIGIFFLALSCLYLAGSFSISTFNPFGNRGLTSRSIPQLIGGIMAILSFFQIIGSALRTKNHTEKAPVEEVKERFKFNKYTRRLLISLLSICAYIFFYRHLGFILSSVLFLLAEMFLLTPGENRKRWAAFIICFSIILPIGIYFLFTKLLSLFLPRGLIG